MNNIGDIMEQRAKNNTCIYCEAPLWKKENQSGDAWICKGCYREQVDENLAAETKERFAAVKKRDSNLIMLLNKIRKKADLPVLQYDIDEMEQYAKPVDPVVDDDIPF